MANGNGPPFPLPSATPLQTPSNPFNPLQPTEMHDMFKAPLRAALLLAAIAAVIGGSLTHAPTAHRTVDATQQIRLLSGGGGVTLPATFPAVVPIPAGKLIGASTGPGRWSLLLRMSGSAATVQRAAI